MANESIIGIGGKWRLVGQRRYARWMLTTLAFIRTHRVLISRIGLVVLAAVVLWIAVVAPRMEAAKLREEIAAQEAEAAALEAQRRKAAADAQSVLIEAASQVAQERAAALDTAARDMATHTERTKIIRERVIERAAQPDGDPLVSDGMKAFLEDLRQ